MSEAADALQHADRNVSRDEDHRFPPKRNDAGEREPRTTTPSRIHVRQRAQTPECHARIGLDSPEAMGSENSFVTNGFGDRPVDERELGADHVRIVLRRQRRQGCAPPQVIVSGIGHRAPRKGVLAMDDEGGRERRRPTERMHVDQVAGPAAYLLPSGERGKRRTQADPTGSASCLPASILPRCRAWRRLSLTLAITFAYARRPTSRIRSGRVTAGHDAHPEASISMRPNVGGGNSCGTTAPSPTPSSEPTISSDHARPLLMRHVHGASPADA